MAKREKSKALVRATKAPQVRQKQIDSSNLLELAINKKGGVDVTTLEALIRLRAQEEDRQAKRLFEERFAIMQKEFPSISKSKSAKGSDGTLLYKYCPLENILVVYGPILTRNGFSFYWDEKPVSGKDNEKEITCFISGHGYTKSASMIIPIEPATRFANSIQQRAISTTYGKRYTFCSAVGVIIAGEDNDGQNIKEPQEITPELKNIRQAVTKQFVEMKKSKKYGDEEIKSKSAKAAELKDDIDGLKKLLQEWTAEFDKK